ncbi:MAG: hypothetical protein HQL47_00620 [Gammaproteobacteria bacterium]|nr:hypothetical protein [Gammaproteobacteria bacterium]
MQIIIIMAILFYSSVLDAATIFIKDKAIWYEGKSMDGDYKRFIELAKELNRNNNSIFVKLNSEGGDVVEAMKIARLIHSLNASTNVVSIVLDSERTAAAGKLLFNPVKDVCYSACFILFISGSSRYILDDSNHPVKLGMHRPYFEEKYFASLGLDEAREKYKDMENEVREFLVEIDFPRNLIDRMFATASDDMHMITSADFKKMNLQYKPYFYEWVKNKCGLMTSINFDKSNLDSLTASVEELKKRGACEARELVKHQRLILKQY